MEIVEPLIEVYLKINYLLKSKGLKEKELRAIKEQLDILVLEQKIKSNVFENQKCQPVGYYHEIDDELKQVEKEKADFVVLETSESNYFVLFKTKDKNWDKPYCRPART